LILKEAFTTPVFLWRLPTFDRYRLFREWILPKLFSLRAQLESLYCAGNGRPALDPVMLAGVTLLQFMEKVPDRVAARHGVYHMGWVRLGFN
jgi:hypothetical protein